MGKVLMAEGSWVKVGDKEVGGEMVGVELHHSTTGATINIRHTVSANTNYHTPERYNSLIVSCQEKSINILY